MAGAGRGFPDAPTVPPFDPIILRPRAEESVSPVLSRNRKAKKWDANLASRLPLIRPFGPPSPRGRPTLRRGGFHGTAPVRRTFLLREGPPGGIFLAKQEFFLYFTARI